MFEVLSLETSDEVGTHRVAAALAELLTPGDVVALEGTLGAGKTSFARGVCAALRVPWEAGFSSPTYALVNLYEGGDHAVAHLDLYRMASADELEGVGFRDLIEDAWVVLVEWPDRIPEVLDDASVHVRLGDLGPERRSISVWATEPQRWEKLRTILTTSEAAS
ncbi:MAG: tRNA (adenosine(37)-N6)-threonylcarbamoyltransferase complex ATPase subunit type 1 TsaE [Myxococcota bacterium]|nr:tRNA (adenosine(37)-N6)-threonylcarbamoyltransferase complex ATPase subunit type 1 TsaE [Myxococcota bacterium]